MIHSRFSASCPLLSTHTRVSTFFSLFFSVLSASNLLFWGWEFSSQKSKYASKKGESSFWPVSRLASCLRPPISLLPTCWVWLSALTFVTNQMALCGISYVKIFREGKLSKSSRSKREEWTAKQRESGGEGIKPEKRKGKQTNKRCQWVTHWRKCNELNN